jgi:AcrR family transcriptional regulator
MIPFTKRQTEIIETAMRIISQEGLENLTIKKMAKNLKITEPALYRHFESKADILLNILIYFEEMADSSLRLINNQIYPPVERIYQILKKRCENFTRNPALFTVVLAEELFPNDERLSEKVRSIMELNHQFISKAIKEAQKNGEIRKDIEEESIFLFLLGPFRLIVTQWRLSNFSFNLIQKFEEWWGSFKKLVEV